MSYLLNYPASYLRRASLSSRLRIGAQLAFVLLLAAYVLQYLFGYQPCALCLQQRVLWWLLLLLCALSQLPIIARAVYLFSLVAFLLLLASVSLSLYHVGGERGLWSLTLLCEGFALTPDLGVEELREILLAREVVSCQRVSLRLLGLSLAEYNAIFSLLLASLFADGLLRESRAISRRYSKHSK